MRLENDMKKARFTESQILAILKQGESGVPVADLCREHGISNATYYNWRSKYGGMDASLMAEMKAMAEENRRLGLQLRGDSEVAMDLLRQEVASDRQLTLRQCMGRPIWEQRARGIRRPLLDVQVGV